MAYISVAKATEYFTGTRNLAEWNAIDDANKGNLLQRASQRIESVPFEDDNPNRTSARYDDSDDTIPLLLLTAATKHLSLIHI